MNPQELKTEDALDEEAVQETKTFIGVNDPLIPESSVKKEDLEYLQSGKTWDSIGVNERLALRLNQMGFKSPSLIQFKVIRIASLNSVVAQSQNGSGKTLAYLVPILNSIDKLQSPPESGRVEPRVLILADTKALILQVYNLLKRICDTYSSVKIDYAFSGKNTVEKGTSVLITTLVQVKNLIQKKELEFDKIEFLVVDEADSVFDSDLNRNYFQSFVFKLLKNDSFKTILTSATMTDNFRKVIQSMQEKKNVIQIELPVEKLTLNNVQQFRIECADSTKKIETLIKLIGSVQAQNILIFDNKRRELEALQGYLSSLNFKSAFIYKANADQQSSNALSADIVQQQISDFLAGKFRILLTTNLLSRGIDMRKVTLVINLALPFKFKEVNGVQQTLVDLETYLHRVGRTGRFGDKGIAVNFINNGEEAAMMQEIQNFYKNDVKKIEVDSLKDLDLKLQEIQQTNKEKREFLEESI